MDKSRCLRHRWNFSQALQMFWLHLQAAILPLCQIPLWNVSNPHLNHIFIPPKRAMWLMSASEILSLQPPVATSISPHLSQQPFKGKGKMCKENEIEAKSFTFTALTLESHDLTNRLDHVLLVVKLFPSGNCLNELLHVGIPHRIVTEIMTMIEIDEGHLE